MQNSVQTQQSTTERSMYVHAYTIMRSLTSFQRFNVVAVDRRGELLATVLVDLEFEDAATAVETLNGNTEDSE